MLYSFKFVSYKNPFGNVVVGIFISPERIFEHLCARCHGIILFGSVARGDYDEGSDIDLLVIFRDEDVMRRNEWEVTRRVPSDVFAQSICVCRSTIKSVNPVFLRSVWEDGVILYMGILAEWQLTLEMLTSYRADFVEQKKMDFE